MSTKKQKIVIIDGNALLHRSFHALPISIKTKDGVIVNAVFGFASALLKSIKDLKPDYLLVAMDKKGPTFRHKKFAEYKATRVKAPNELYQQIPLIKQLIKIFDIPLYEQEGFEADDLIGTICKQLGDSLEKIIVTGDMDLMQLIDDYTKVYRMSHKIGEYSLFGELEVKNKYNINPSQIIDYKALCGDSSDNIPGVKGIGQKTAEELLKEFESLNGIYENINSLAIKDRTRKLLLEKKEDAYLSQDLATIKLDVPIKFDLEESQMHTINQKQVLDFLSSLEFKSLLPRVRELFSSSSLILEKEIDKFERDKNNFDYNLIDNDQDFNDFFSKLKQQKFFAFDTETEGVNPLLDNLMGISFAWDAGCAYYVNLKNRIKRKEKKQENNLFSFSRKEEIIDNSDWIDRLKEVFINNDVKKYAHNMKFDLRFVEKAFDIEIKGVEFDTMIASYLLNPGTRQNNLDAVSFVNLGFEKISKDDLLGKGKDKTSFEEVGLERLFVYSAEDADCTFQLVEKLDKQLKEKNLFQLFQEIEMPLIKVLAKMEDNGIMLDKEFLAKMSKEINQDIKKLEEKIHNLAGVKFNIKSTKQLKEILFDKLKISDQGIKKTKTGFSTAFDELEKIKDKHEIIHFIQDYRELTKLVSTYIDALPLLVNPTTARVHTSFNQTITATGRLSSTDPNLQNIPTRTELGKKIRKAFIVPEGYKLLAIDYSQIELRIAAHLSEDTKMIKAFQNNADIHTSTASEINKIAISEVTKDLRRDAKAINFGVLYGQGAHGLAQATGLSYNEARIFIDNYFLAYPQVKQYLDSQIKKAQEEGFVETMFGRKRFLADINSSIPMIKKSAERMAINTPIQGSAADIIKIAMIEVDKKIEEYRKKGIEVAMLLQVHDELLFEIPEKYVKEIAQEIKEIMEKVVILKVPIIADVKIGDNWGELLNF